MHIRDKIIYHLHAPLAVLLILGRFRGLRFFLLKFQFYFENTCSSLSEFGKDRCDLLS